MRTLHAFAFGAAVFAASLFGGAAQAAVFNFNGVCTTDCGNIGLAFGDTVSVSLTIDDAAIGANALLDTADLTDFTLDFGTVDIDLASQFALSFSGQMNAAADGLASFFLATSEQQGAGPPADGVAMQLGEWVASESTSCTPGCGVFTTEPGTLAEGTFEDEIAIPEPASALLFGAALAALGLSRRRRAV